MRERKLAVGRLLHLSTVVSTMSCYMQFAPDFNHFLFEFVRVIDTSLVRTLLRLDFAVDRFYSRSCLAATD